MKLNPAIILLTILISSFELMSQCIDTTAYGSKTAPTNGLITTITTSQWAGDYAKGGYGKKGYTENGTYYQSFLEKQCFEFLENKQIEFEPHKQLPNSAKSTDIFIPSINLWIELDGINRELKRKYIGKNYGLLAIHSTVIAN